MINRCAAIVIGIGSIILILDVLAGPEIVPGLLGRIGTGLAKVRAVTDGLLRDGLQPDTDARTVALLSAASNQHLPLSNASAGTQWLRSVNAVYTWVRLAQRVPVRIRITAVPPGVPLVSGLTATVTVRKGSADQASPGPLDLLLASAREDLAPEPPAQDCIPATVGGSGPEARLLEPTTTPSETPEQLAPGLADGPTAKPKKP